MENIANIKKYTFMGNPGVGKSAILNSTLSKNLFKSAFCFNAVTTENQIEFSNGSAYIDTPGVDDPKIHEIAVKKIKEAFSFGGQYCLIFVVTTSGGRIVNSDAKTVKMISDALQHIPNVNFNIIVNKIPSEGMDCFQDSENSKEFVNLVQELIGKTCSLDQFYFLPYVSKSKGEEILSFPKEFLEFINSTKITEIDGSKVLDIEDEEIKKKRLELEKQAEDQRIEAERLENLRKQEIARQQQVLAQARANQGGGGRGGGGCIIS